MKIEAVPGPANVLGETPVWSAAERRLWWVDIRSSEVLSWRPDDGALARWSFPDLACGVALRRSGGLIVASRKSILAFNPDSGCSSPLMTVETDPPQNRLNELRCDRSGNLWIGSMWDLGLQVSGALYRAGADLEITRVRTDVRIPNAIALSPDGRTLYFADTGTGKIEQATLDPDTGLPSPWRTFVKADAAPGRPDGATVDANGYLWNARIGGACLARFAPDGRLNRIVPLPVSNPTACAFGGSDLETLYVTTATQGLSKAERAAQPLAGRLLALKPGVTGLAESKFAG